MDDNFNRKLDGKKQRQRNLRDKRKPQEKKGEPVSPAATDSNVNEPQPQRANRRQRNDAPPTPTTDVSNSVPSCNAGEKDLKVTSEKENVTIDFSNLKRETEEISKLTKKFAKRNITSNWHRYSAPEGAKNDEIMEEDGPADFSALVQVPASKGGHFQLKDEEEWASASNEQLGGYFTLNLKLLSQSLACIPLHEQLRLPKQMFTDEELEHFENVASEARKLYNSNQVEDPNESVYKQLTNLLKEEKGNVGNLETKTNISDSNDISSLQLSANNQELSNINLETKLIHENSPEVVFNLTRNQEVSIEKSKLPFNTTQKENSVEKEEINFDSSSLLRESIKDPSSLLSSLMKNEILEDTKIQSPLSKDSNKIDHIDEAKSFVEAENKTAKSTKATIPPLNQNNPESIVTIDAKEKHGENNKGKSIKKVEENKLNNVENPVTFDDDDDLDFLLTLKKTNPTSNKTLNSNKAKAC